MTSQYPDHLSESVRKEVAAYFVWHEYKKLFPTIKDNTVWEHMLVDINNWHANEDYPKPIRSFWNDINAITYHMKLKDLVPLLTSSNITWLKDGLELTSLTFNTGGPGFDVLGPDIKDVAQIKEFYSDPKNSELKNETLKRLTEKGYETTDRETDPIIVVEEKDKRVIIDGNRRVMKCLLEQSDIRFAAYLGKVMGEPKYQDFWVPTTELIKLVNLYRKSLKDSLELSEQFAAVIAYTIKDSSVAQYELKERCLDMTKSDEDIFYNKIMGSIATINATKK